MFIIDKSRGGFSTGFYENLTGSRVKTTFVKQAAASCGKRKGENIHVR